MHLIDTHCHLDFTDFDLDRPQVIARAGESGVHEMISIGTGLDSSARAVELAENFPQVWSTIGIHPCDVENLSENYLPILRQLATNSRVVALGEIGLDYHHLPKETNGEQAVQVYRERQEIVFRQQLDLAIELGLNVVIHQRDAWDDTLCILKDYTGKVRGVFHCFGGSPEQAQEVINLGHLVSFTGIVTFKNAAQVQGTVKKISADRFMVETDCPYLAPVPHRGKRCEPAYTRLVADFIATLRGVSVEAIADQTTQTARQFFSFDR